MTSSTTEAALNHGVFLATARRVITREAQALEILSGALGESFARAVDLILAAQGRVIVSGMGGAAAGVIAGSVPAPCSQNALTVCCLRVSRASFTGWL